MSNKNQIVKGEGLMENVANEVLNVDVVMLYSGGADSLLMLHLAKMAGKNPYCLLIDYGQKHIEELDYAVKQLDSIDVKYQIIKINGLNINSGLTGDLVESRWENVHPMNVPARNTIFLGLAMSVAENMGIDEVWYGPDYSDRINLFPDCYQEYVVKMNEVSAISGVKPIKIVAPLLGMSKELILQILQNQFGYTMSQIHSGYEPPVCACGKSECTCDHHESGC
jgi:7-cyano-7-deazaguanine synthase